MLWRYEWTCQRKVLTAGTGRCKEPITQGSLVDVIAVLKRAAVWLTTSEKGIVSKVSWFLHPLYDIETQEKHKKVAGSTSPAIGRPGPDDATDKKYSSWCQVWCAWSVCFHFWSDLPVPNTAHAAVPMQTSAIQPLDYRQHVADCQCLCLVCSDVEATGAKRERWAWSRATVEARCALPQRRAREPSWSLTDFTGISQTSRVLCIKMSYMLYLLSKSPRWLLFCCCCCCCCCCLRSPKAKGLQPPHTGISHLAVPSNSFPMYY